MSRYLNKDPSMIKTTAVILAMWMLTVLAIFTILSQPTIPQFINPIVYPLNGAILHSDYVPAEIK